MNNKELLAQLRKPPGEARAHWHQAMRLVMSLRTVDGDVDWESADLGSSNDPVGAEAWQAWLRTEPEHVWLMTGLLDREVRRPGIPTYEDVLKFVVEQVPTLAHRFIAYHSDPVRTAIELNLGAALGAASGGLGGVDWGDSPNDELVGEWLAARLERPKTSWSPFSLKTLNRRATISGALAEVYPAISLAILKSVRKGAVSELSIRTDWLTSEQLLKIFKALRSKPANLDVIMRATVEQGTVDGLDAIASLLPDKKVGDVALFWLGCAGFSGLTAAHARWNGKKGAVAKRAVDRIAELSALPLGESIPSGPRSILPSNFAPWEPNVVVPSGDSEPALGREKLVSLCAGHGTPPIAQDELSPAEWADYLQVTSMDAWLTHPGPTWDRAREAGWLGLGSAPDALMAAAKRLDPKGRTHWNSHAPISWGHLFLWAGADRDSYVGALALCLRYVPLRRTLGWVDTHFVEPVQDAKVPWSEEVVDWMERIKRSRPQLGPVDLRLADDVVHWEPIRHALVANVPSQGHAAITLGDQRIEIEPAAGAMRLHGPVEGVRNFPPTSRPVQVAVTRSTDGLLLTFGSVAWGDVPMPAGGCCAEGLDAVELRREAQVHWFGLRRLLQGDTAGAALLASLHDREAARLLTIVATLRPDCSAPAVTSALAELGDTAAEYRSLLGIESAEPPRLPDRTFADVLSDLQEEYGAKLQTEDGWSWAAGYGVVEHGFHGPALIHLDVDALPSALELRGLASECPLYPTLARADFLKFRDSIGMREACWMLVPDDGGFGNGPLFYHLHAACWPVTDGFALAIWSGFDVPSIERLLGVPFVPSSAWQVIG